MKPTMGELFAGIGGFSLGFERAGFEVAWQVEIEPFCRKVLAKHFPNAERFEDVREVGKHNLRVVDVICGGFPCQDISAAGKRAGIEGERSGLWSEFRRIISELRPRFVVVENVAALLERGIERVLGDMAELGYDAEWQVISAADFGAPHLRERVWIVAYPRGVLEHRTVFPENSEELGWQPSLGCKDWKFFEMVAGVPTGCNLWRGMGEPGLVRKDDGVPDVLDRLHACGNSIVPQIPEWIAGLILRNLVNA